MGRMAKKLSLCLWFTGVALFFSSSAFSQTQGVMGTFFTPPQFQPNTQIHLSGSSTLKDHEEKAGAKFSQKIKTHESSRFFNLGSGFSSRWAPSFLGVERWQAANLNFSYSHDAFLPKGWVLEFQVNSSSDQPFHSLDETGFSLMGMKNLSKTKSSSWYGSLFLSSQPGFIEGIPIPGVMWAYHETREFLVLLGIPFIFLKKNFHPSSEIKFTLFFPRMIRVEHLWEWRGGIKFSQFFENRWDSYLRANRETRDEEVQFLERKAGFGFFFPVSKNVSLDPKLSYVMKREQFEAESIFSEKSKRTKLDSGIQFSIDVQATF